MDTIIKNYLSNIKWLNLMGLSNTPPPVIVDLSDLRLVSENTRYIIDNWKETEYPDLPLDDLSETLTNLAQSDKFELYSSGDYGQYTVTIEKQHEELRCLVDVYAGARRSQWERVISSLNIRPLGKEPQFTFDGDLSACDITWLVLAFRLMHIPNYLCENLVKESCVSDRDSANRWFHSDVCVSSSMSYNIRYFSNENEIYKQRDVDIGFYDRELFSLIKHSK